MPTSNVEAHKAASLEQLREEHAELLVAMLEAEEDFRSQQAGHEDARVARASAMMTVIATKVGNLLTHLAQSGRKAADSERLFRHDLGITRDLKRPDPFATTALVALGWTVETIFTAISLFADGHVDLIPALGFGMTFSSVNIGLGLGAGYIARFLNYRKTSLTQQSGDQLVRRLALGGVAGFSLAHLLMVFAGGRTRVLGGHEAIFSFSEVSFAATFRDGLALVIMVSAVLSFLIAAAKGYSGLADPIPGYADHVGSSSDEIFEQAELIVDEALGALEETGDGTIDELEELATQPEGLEDLRADIAAFNARVDAEKDKIRVLALQEWEKRCIVAGEDVRRPRLDLSAFDGLKLDLDSQASAAPRPDLIDTLRQAQVEATSAIQTAFAAFAAAIHRGVVLPPLSDPED